MSATEYLNGTVGNLLVQGVASTVASNPADPVEFLAEWLLRRVQADAQREQHAKDKQQHDQELLRKTAQEQEAQHKQEEAVAARTAAIQGLANMVADPLDLWQAAVQLAKSYTSAAAVYVANIVDDELPDYALPEDAEADLETEDESASAPASDNTEAAEGDGAAEGEADQEPEEAAADGEACSSGSSSGPPDYSTKLLRYVAASPGQDFIKSVELRRPKRAEDDSSDAEHKPEPVPVTFRVLDEGLPLLEVPVVAAEPRVKFLRGLPKVGGYCAVAVPAGPAGPSAGSFQAVLAADSLLPEGSGAALSAGDVTVLWDTAQALGKALDAAAAVKRTEAARGGGAELVAELTASLQQLRQAAAAPEPVPDVGEAPAGPEGEEGSEVSPADAVNHAEAEVQHYEAVVAACKAAVTNAAAALDLEKQALAAVVKAITGVRGTAVRALKLCTSSPPATFHVLRAVLLLLGLPPAAVASWREASSQIHLGLFEQIAAYDATQERDAACWKLVRAAYKAVQSPKDLQKELPQCALGSLLLTWIKEVRAVARKAAALREAEKQLAAAEADKTAKEQGLVKAKEAQVEAEKAQATAAAAAEAEAAAAAAAEAEEQAGEEEADE